MVYVPLINRCVVLYTAEYCPIAQTKQCAPGNAIDMAGRAIDEGSVCRIPVEVIPRRPTIRIVDRRLIHPDRRPRTTDRTSNCSRTTEPRPRSRTPCRLPCSKSTTHPPDTGEGDSTASHHPHCRSPPDPPRQTAAHHRSHSNCSRTTEPRPRSRTPCRLPCSKSTTHPPDTGGGDSTASHHPHCRSPPDPPRQTAAHHRSHSNCSRTTEPRPRSRTPCRLPCSKSTTHPPDTAVVPRTGR